MRIFKNLKAATIVSILSASFMFLLPGAGISQADGYARHFKPDHINRNHVNPANKHGYHKNAARQHDRQITQRIITTTRYSTPRGTAQRHADKSCRTNTSRHQRGNNWHQARNSFKHHQKLRHSNFRSQRHGQQHLRHNLGLFAALPGIIVNIPL
ncbi:MAG: hypothetical protein LC645_08300 [Geobacteraceae bacterium]|nr:hypothetical protein [Geobacteraceae bacterium]